MFHGGCCTTHTESEVAVTARDLSQVELRATPHFSVLHGVAGMFVSPSPLLLTNRPIVVTSNLQKAEGT